MSSKKTKNTISPLFDDNHQSSPDSFFSTQNESQIYNLLQSILNWAFMAIFIATPLFFTWFNEELFEFNKIFLIYGLTIIIGMSWLGKIILTKKAIFKRTILDIPILLFFISQLISTILSIHPRTSFLGYYTRFNGGLLSTITYIFIYYAFVSNFQRADIKKFLTTNIVVSIIISIYAILEHFGHSFSCVLINSAGIFSGQTSFSDAFTTSCWVQLVQERVFASFGQPNWLATYIVTILPINLSLLSINYLSKNKIKLTSVKNKISFLQLDNTQYWLTWISAILLFMSLLFTKSRSGFIACIASLILIIIGAIFIYYFNQKNNSSSFSKKTFFKQPIFIFSAATILMIAIFGSPFIPSADEWPNLIAIKFAAPKINPNSTDSISPPASAAAVATPTPLSEAGGTDSGEIRKIVWEGAIKVWQHYPLFGSGAETFGYSYYLERPMAHNLVSEWDFLYNKAHNEFLNYLATTGIFGLGTYLILLGYFSFACLQSLYKKEIDLDQKIFNLSLLASILAMLIANFFGFSTVYSNVLLFIIFAFFILANPTEKNKELDLSLNLNNFAKIICLIAIFILGGFLLIKNNNFWQADYNFFRAKANFRKNTVADIELGLKNMDQAIHLTPQEALFYSELSDIYAQLSVAYFKQNTLTVASDYEQKAIAASQKSLELNPHQLNFYKTALRVYLNLAQVNLKYITEVEIILDQAIALAPTDVKLKYNLAIVYFNVGKNQAGFDLLGDIVTNYRPNYHEARYYLAQREEEIGNLTAAKDNYQYILQYIDPEDQRSIGALSRIATYSATIFQ